MGGSELEALCKKVYREHREAIDLIIRYRPETQSDLRQLLEELVDETDAVIPLVPVKPQTEQNFRKHCPFIPLEWDGLIPNSALASDNWTTRICNFVIVNLPTEMHILLQLRPGAESDRLRLYQIAERAGLVSGSRIAKYQEIRRWNILTAKDYRTTTPTALHEIVRAGWNDFVQDELPRITEVFRHGLAEQNG